MSIERTDEEIEEQRERATAHIVEGKVAWPGMSYEQGVQRALDWVTGDDDEPPMEDE